MFFRELITGYRAFYLRVTSWKVVWVEVMEGHYCSMAYVKLVGGFSPVPSEQGFVHTPVGIDCHVC